MTDRGEVHENMVVLAFLRAEIESRRFQSYYEEGLRVLGKNRTDLIDVADLTSEADNSLRASLLQRVRGFPDQYLFSGFPSDVVWHNFDVSLEELGGFKYGNFPEWNVLSGNKRLVLEGARNAGNVPTPENSAINILAVEQRIRAGERFPELIAVRDSRSADIVLVEGHTRATAYLLAKQPPNVEAFIGSSAFMHQWCHL